MSCKIQYEMMRHKFGNPIHKLIMIFLADGCDESSYFYPIPNYEKLSILCEISEKELMINLKQLEESEIIKIWNTNIQIL